MGIIVADGEVVESSWDRRQRWWFSYYSFSWSPTTKKNKMVAATGTVGGVLTLLSVVLLGGALFVGVGRFFAPKDDLDSWYNGDRSKSFRPTGITMSWNTEVQGASLGGFFLDWTLDYYHLNWTIPDLPEGFRCLIAFPYQSDYYHFFLWDHYWEDRIPAILHTMGVCPGVCEDSSDDQVDISEVLWWSNALYPVSFSSSDSVTVDIIIDGTHYEYDPSQGCAFLLSLDNDGAGDGADSDSDSDRAIMQVQQVALDLSGVDPYDVEASIPSLVEQSEEFLAFAQEIATAAAQSDDDNA